MFSLYSNSGVMDFNDKHFDHWLASEHNEEDDTNNANSGTTNNRGPNGGSGPVQNISHGRLPDNNINSAKDEASAILQARNRQTANTGGLAVGGVGTGAGTMTSHITAPGLSANNARRPTQIGYGNLLDPDQFFGNIGNVSLSAMGSMGFGSTGLTPTGTAGGVGPTSYYNFPTTHTQSHSQQAHTQQVPLQHTQSQPQQQNQGQQRDQYERSRYPSVLFPSLSMPPMPSMPSMSAMQPMGSNPGMLKREDDMINMNMNMNSMLRFPRSLQNFNYHRNIEDNFAAFSYGNNNSNNGANYSNLRTQQQPQQQSNYQTQQFQGQQRIAASGAAAGSGTGDYLTPLSVQMSMQHMNNMQSMQSMQNMQNIGGMQAMNVNMGIPSQMSVQQMQQMQLPLTAESVLNLVHRKRINSWTPQEEAFLIGVVVAKYLSQGSLFGDLTISNPSSPTSPGTPLIDDNANIDTLAQKKRKRELLQAQSSTSEMSAVLTTMSLPEGAKAKSKSKAKSLAIESCWASIKEAFDLVWSRYTQKTGYARPCERTAQALARHYKVMKTKLKAGQQDDFHGLYSAWRNEYDIDHCLLDAEFFSIQDYQKSKEASDNAANARSSLLTLANMSANASTNQPKLETYPSHSMSMISGFRKNDSNEQNKGDNNNVQMINPASEHNQLQQQTWKQDYLKEFGDVHLQTYDDDKDSSLTMTYPEFFQRVNSWNQHEEIILVGVVVDRFITRGSLVSPRKSKGGDDDTGNSDDIDNDCWSVIKRTYDLAWQRFTDICKIERPQERTVNALSRHYKVMRARIMKSVKNYLDTEGRIPGNSKEGKGNITLSQIYDNWVNTYNKNNVLVSPTDL